jgi:two-component system chemotaxis response regulator CheY
MARILLADRVLFMRNITRFALEYGGHEVVEEAEDGREALNLFIKTKPDLLITEIILPKINGLQILNKIREKDLTSKIIICSTVSQEKMIEQALHRGADSYIVKPFYIPNFLIEVNRVLGVSEQPGFSRVKELNINEKEELKQITDRILTKTISPEELRAFISLLNQHKK